MIEVKNLTLGYPRNPSVLNEVTLNIKAGEIVNILGPNGCGKTTLLKAILGFLPLPPNQVLLDGRALEKFKRPELARRLAYVPQAHQGIFHYKVDEVVMMGRTVHSPFLRFSNEDRRLTREALEKVNISHLAHRSYLELSGGQRQLVLIARALAQKCAFLIMDEPVNGLDYGHQFHLLDTVKALADNGPAVILSTHHPQQALYLGGRALLMKNGRLMADGPVELIVTRQQIKNLYGLSDKIFEKVRSMMVL